MVYKPKKRVSLFAKISLSIFLPCIVLYILSKRSALVADFLDSTLCHATRRAMAALFDSVSFSVFEVLVALIPLWIILIVVLARRALKSGRGVRFAVNLFAVVLLVFSQYILTLGISYNTTTIADRMGLRKTAVTEEKLAEIMTELRDEVNRLSAEISYNGEGESYPEYSFREASEKICDSFSDFSEEYGFPATFASHAKPIHFGEVMSYFRLTGIYTFYTGESNVNSAYPMYDMVFTAAHELSHQRGIMRENEANFMAYLVNSGSEDVYLRYSAALSMYEYIGSALFKTNKELYYEISSGLLDAPRGDIIASSAVTKKYGDTFLADISNYLNDLFLKSNGTAGVVTYGQVVNLTVAYFEQMK